MFVTRFGVSVLNVVATIETPTSHHGAARPEVKNSAVLDPPGAQESGHERQCERDDDDEPVESGEQHWCAILLKDGVAPPGDTTGADCARIGR